MAWEIEMSNHGFRQVWSFVFQVKVREGDHLTHSIVECVAESTSDSLNDIWGCAVELVNYSVAMDFNVL